MSCKLPGTRAWLVSHREILFIIVSYLEIVNIIVNVQMSYGTSEVAVNFLYPFGSLTLVGPTFLTSIPLIPMILSPL